MNKHFEALELNIVLDMLAAEASCPDAAEKAKSITPVFDMACAHFMSGTAIAAECAPHLIIFLRELR